MNLLKNEIETLKVLFLHDNATKSEIAEKSRLSTFVVSTAIESLIKKGLVEVSKETLSKRGRPSNLYQIRLESGYFLGISADINSFNVVLIDTSNKVLGEKVYPTCSIEVSEKENKKKIDNFIEKLLFAIDDFIGNNSIYVDSIHTIGLGIPGIIDTEKGIWLRGLRVPGIEDINIRKIIKDKYKKNVVIEDVARTVTYYEKAVGNGRNTTNFILLHMGFGVGGGIVINNELYRGSYGFAGEIGHMAVEPSGYRCHCGNVGCLETVASVDGILHHLNDRMNEVIVSKMHSHDFHLKEFKSLEEVLEAARKGDTFTRSVLSDIGTLIGDACSNLVLFFNPERIIISGPNLILADFLKDAIHQRIKNKVVSELLRKFELIFSRYSSNHEAYGAALVAKEVYWKKILRIMR